MKLPPIYLPTSCGKIFTDDSGSVYGSVDAYVRAADASLALDVPISDVVKYEPAVPRCKTCCHYQSHLPLDLPRCFFLNSARDDDFCSNHIERVNP